MRRIIVLLAALLAGSALFSGAPAHLAGASRVMGGQLPLRQASANVTTHGVRLVLELPGTAYPPNALVLATIHLTNLTKRDISTADCLSSSLSAEVVRQDGLAVYPPLLPPPGAPWTACIGSIAQPRALNVLHVLPGQTVTRMAYVVLRAFSVRARAELYFGATEGKPTVIETPLLHLHATHAAGPLLRLGFTPTMSAQVTPVPGAGPILYSQFASCRDSAHARYPVKESAAFSRWTRASGSILRPFNSPPCTSLGEWYLFAGQPGRSVAHVYYCARTDRCYYPNAPPTRQEQAISACKQDIADALRPGRLPPRPKVAQYALGLTSTQPPGLPNEQSNLAQAFHKRCAPLLHLLKHR